LELATGTFYLLMLAVGTVAGALAAWAGAGEPLQLVAAALVGGGAVAVWHWKRPAGAPADTAQQQEAAQLDVGERVQVTGWDDDGQTRVHYRGTSWQAKYQGASRPAPGQHVIVAVEANRLVLAPRQP
jgi:membrane protein implicated in regulation of membrane protease activity